MTNQTNFVFLFSFQFLLTRARVCANVSRRKQALQAKVEADKEGIVVPLTLEEYCLKPKTNPNNQEPQVRYHIFTFPLQCNQDQSFY